MVPLQEPAPDAPPQQIEVGEDGPETIVISGCFDFEETLIRITPDIGNAVPSFEQNLQFIAREVQAGRPGRQIVLTRMADVIFVQVLRAYIESLPVDVCVIVRSRGSSSTSRSIRSGRRNSAFWEGFERRRPLGVAGESGGAVDRDAQRDEHRVRRRSRSRPRSRSSSARSSA